jgi:hypothetical protein
MKMVSQGSLKVADDARPVAEVAEATVKNVYAAGFRRIGEATGQIYQSWWRICGEIIVFPRLEYHIFTFYIHFSSIY